MQKAREADHEFFTRVSENRLLDEPGLLPLRKELLEAAVAYYEGLAAGTLYRQNIVTYQDFLATHRACFGRFLRKHSVQTRRCSSCKSR